MAMSTPDSMPASSASRYAVPSGRIALMTGSRRMPGAKMAAVAIDLGKTRNAITNAAVAPAKPAAILFAHRDRPLSTMKARRTLG